MESPLSTGLKASLKKRRRGEKDKGSGSDPEAASLSSRSLASASSAEAVPALALTPPARPARDQTPSLSGRDWAVVAVLIVGTFALRVWQIEQPQGIVWDESHFTKFLTWYFTGHYFVDIHPPLAKLVFAYVLTWTPFRGANEYNVEWWTERGFVGTKDWLELYKDDQGAPYYEIRVTSAVVGSLLVAATYIAVRMLGCGRCAAAFGAWMVLCENLVTLQSRLILTDVFLYFFNMATFAASFASTRPGLSPRAQLVWSAVVGLLLGGAISVKYTALGTVGLVALHQAMALLVRFAQDSGAPSLRLRRIVPTALQKAGLIVGVALVVFFALWTVHIAVLPYSGQGTGFMNDDFKLTLRPKLRPEQTNLPPDACPNHANAMSDCGFGGITKQQCEELGCCYDPTSPTNWCYHKGVIEWPTMSWFRKMAAVLHATWKNNQGEGLRIHPHMSEWYEWPTMDMKLIPFTSGGGGRVLSIGNPVVWWGVSATLVVSLVVGVWRLRIGSLVAHVVWGDRQKHKGGELKPHFFWESRFVVLWAGYVGNLLPFVLITRSKFNYHYVPALLVGCLLCALCVDWCLVHSARPRGVRVVVGVLAVLLTWAHWYWGAWTYGFPLSQDEHAARRWMAKWR